jgi:hypothetical protein
MRRSGTGRDDEDGIGQKKRKSPDEDEKDAWELQQRQHKLPRLLETRPARDIEQQERKSSLRSAISASTESVASSTMPKSSPATSKTSTLQKLPPIPRKHLLVKKFGNKQFLHDTKSIRLSARVLRPVFDGGGICSDG